MKGVKLTVSNCWQFLKRICCVIAFDICRSVLLKVEFEINENKTKAFSLDMSLQSKNILNRIVILGCIPKGRGFRGFHEKGSHVQPESAR